MHTTHPSTQAHTQHTSMHTAHTSTRTQFPERILCSLACIFICFSLFLEQLGQSQRVAAQLQADLQLAQQSELAARVLQQDAEVDAH